MYIYIYDIYMIYIYIYYKDTNEIWVKIAIFQMDADFPNQRGNTTNIFPSNFEGRTCRPWGNSAWVVLNPHTKSGCFEASISWVKKICLQANASKFKLASFSKAETPSIGYHLILDHVHTKWSKSQKTWLRPWLRNDDVDAFFCMGH